MDPAAGDALPEEPRTASLEPTSARGAEAPAIGTVVGGKYKLEEVLGRGGMGIVVAATHLALRERVALKFVSLGSSAATSRLLREARLAASIKSDHVARVLDVGTTDGGVPYVVMEHLEGESLAKIIKSRGTLDVAEAIELAREIASGLAAAHARGIVHRDLKPSNVFVARRADGTRAVKVVDFGVAKELTPASADEEGALTSSTTVLGSPFYMAPEQVRSAKHVDARADVWSFGATLHEMLAGRPPFVAETTPGVLAAVVADRPAPLRETRPEIPEALETLVLRCLAKEPSARPCDAEALAAELDAVARGDVPRSRPSARATLRFFAAAALVVVAAVVAWTALARGPEAPTPPAASGDARRAASTGEAPAATSASTNEPIGDPAPASAVAPSVGAATHAKASATSVTTAKATSAPAATHARSAATIESAAARASASTPPPPVASATVIARPDVSAATADRH